MFMRIGLVACKHARIATYLRSLYLLILRASLRVPLLKLRAAVSSSTSLLAPSSPPSAPARLSRTTGSLATVFAAQEKQSVTVASGERKSKKRRSRDADSKRDGSDHDGDGMLGLTNGSHQDHEGTHSRAGSDKTAKQAAKKKQVSPSCEVSSFKRCQCRTHTHDKRNSCFVTLWLHHLSYSVSSRVSLPMSSGLDWHEN